MVKVSIIKEQAGFTKFNIWEERKVYITFNLGLAGSLYPSSIDRFNYLLNTLEYNRYTTFRSN